MSKKCTRCGSGGPFHRDNRARDGLNSWCKKCINEKNTESYYRNKADRLSGVKKWQDENHDKVKRYKTNWNRSNEGYSKRWRANNPDKVREHSHRRRANEAKAEGSYSSSEWESLCSQYDYRCAKCGKKTKLTVDHVIPLSKGGSNAIGNIQPLCLPCNSGKKDKIADYRTKPGILGWIQKKLFG